MPLVACDSNDDQLSFKDSFTRTVLKELVIPVLSIFVDYDKAESVAPPKGGASLFH